MRRVLPIFLLATALFAVPGATPEAQANVPSLRKIAVVDVQRVLLETKQGKSAKTKLEKEFAKSNAKLEKKAKSLEKQYTDFMQKAQAGMLSEAELMRRQEALIAKDAELQELYESLQVKMAEKEALLTEKIYRNVQSIVKQMALEDGLQLVLVRSEATVLYANPKLDVTNRVIVAYDKKYQ